MRYFKLSFRLRFIEGNISGGGVRYWRSSRINSSNKTSKKKVVDEVITEFNTIKKPCKTYTLLFIISFIIFK